MRGQKTLSLEVYLLFGDSEVLSLEEGITNRCDSL